jgi:CHAT domain-containing protein
VSHEIVSAPSASVLSILRRDYNARRPAAKTVAVLADPVFDRQDPRLDPAAAGDSSPGSSVARNMMLRSAAGSGVVIKGRTIRRLPFSAQEASAILSLVPPDERKEALGFDASRSTAMGRDLGRYRFVHFATHSFLNSSHPDLSGIVLSLVTPDGRDQDGFLRAYEIFNLDLPADMVVLSACSTGLGKDVKGEGLVGLTRAFMYAGAARVVVSLWDVDDHATAELMSRMYKGVFGPTRLRPLAALRAAQLEMWKEQRWRAPYHWAAFTMQGEWK